MAGRRAVGGSWALVWVWRIGMPSGIALRISSADRKAVRIARGYLRFITDGCRAGAGAGMSRGGIAGFATQRGRSGRDPGGPGPAPLNAA